MPRDARIVTTSLGGAAQPTLQANLDRGLSLLVTACRQKPDAVCLPENFTTWGLTDPKAELAQPVPGPTTDAVAKFAREHRTYVICPLLTARDGRVYNSAVILDREGQVAGVYDKVNPVTSESDLTVMESGVTPGDAAPPVFDLDFGRVGVQICFDLMFPETWQALADAGAELVFWPSAYDGGFGLRAFAYLHMYYVVSSVRSAHARIINPLGEVIEHTGRALQIAVRTLDLDYMVCHCDYHYGMRDALLDIHGSDVTLRMLHEEGRFLVQSNREDLPMAALAERFGLTPHADYINAHRPACEHLRQGEPAPPQQLPFTGREPYTPMSVEDWDKRRKEE